MEKTTKEILKKRSPLSQKEIERLRQIAKIGGINSAKNQPKQSKGELLLAKLLSHNGYRIEQSSWDIVIGYEIDIFLPDLNIAISYNGEVHIKPIYGIKRLNQVINRDSYRNRKLREMNIKHIIVEDEGRFDIDKVKKQFEWCLQQMNYPTTKDVWVS